ncbi:MAG: hypothetical protein FRX49_12081 [Trebouxia sp. A1-2]|nr:MAG: hypothetical protein FRX49_12081 [Trebouxia sp. A1-2]
MCAACSAVIKRRVRPCRTEAKALRMVSSDTYSFTASEVQAKQSEIKAQHRVKRLIQVRWQEKQHAQLKRQQYKENYQELAVLEQTSLSQAWQNESRQSLHELQQQLSTSLAKAGHGQRAAQAASHTASLLAAQRTADRAAQLQLAKQRFAHALQLRHAEQTAAVNADVTRLQRLSDTMAAESARGHALAQQHRAVQAEAEAHTSAPAVPPWSQAALRNIDYKNTRLHELGGAVLVERNGDKDKNTCNEAAETAAELQIRMAQAAEHRRRIAVDQHAASQARGQTAANQDRLQFKAQQTQIQLEAAQQAQRAQQIKALDAKPPPSLGMRCDGLHAQQQLQRHFEAQFLHKPKDFKAKLLNQQQQQQTRTGSSNAGLHWMACMPAARLQKEPVTHPSGKGKPEAQRDTELEHRRQVPMPTKRQPSLVAGGVKGKAIQSRYQLGESQPCLQEDTSAEDALAEELQEAIAEARSHQSMAAQQRKPQPHYQAHPDAVQYDPLSRRMAEPSTVPAASHTAVLRRHTPPGNSDLTPDSLSMHSMTTCDDISVSHGQSYAEPSEEELLQWQPVLPAKIAQAAANSVRTAMSKPNGVATFPTKKAFLTAAVKLPTTSLQAAAADGSLGRIGRPVLTADVSAAVSKGPFSTCSKLAGPQTALASTPVRPGPKSDQIQTAALSMRAVQEHALHRGTASAALSASAAMPSLASSYSMSSIPHAWHAQPLRPQSSLPVLPCSSSVSREAAAASAAVPAASMSASVDSDWLAADTQQHTDSVSSWSSCASDAHLLRHSTASIATTSLTADAADAIIPPACAVTSHSGAVPAAKASDLPLAPVDWKLPYTAELHDQTAALLSSLTTSVDWDLSAADAQLHRQLDAADKSGPGLASAAMPASDLASITSLSEFSTLPGINSMEAVAAVDRVRQGQGRAARAAGRHSPSSYASSGLLSSRSQHSGTGTLKQSKGHGLSSTDIPSKSASLPEPVGTLSSTSLGHNTAKEAADGELRFSEAADHLTVTTVMTGQAVAKAVTVQVMPPSGASLTTHSAISSPTTSQPASYPPSSSPSSSSLLAENSAGYRGLAAIAGNLAASLSEMLSPDSESLSASNLDLADANMQDTQQESQHAQHEPAAQHAASTGGHACSFAPIIDSAVSEVTGTETGNLLPTASLVSSHVTGVDSGNLIANSIGTSDASSKSAGIGSSRLERHASAVAQRLQEQAAAAIAASEAAMTASSTLSGMSGVQTQAAAPEAAPGSRAAAAMAFSEAAGTPSSIVSGLTELQLQAPQPVDSTELHASAGAAMTLSEAAAAPSITVSGITELQARAAAAMALSEAAAAPSSTVSGITELQARAAAAMALSDAAGPPSSTVLSGMTELAAAGAAMTQAAQSAHVSAGNPFGLTAAHSVDGYALVNAIIAPSSTLSRVTELDAASQTTSANCSASAAATLQGTSAGIRTCSVTEALSPVQGHQDRAAAVTALTDAVTAASSVVSGLTQLAARAPSQAQLATADMRSEDASMASSSIGSDLTDLHDSI